MNTMIRVIGAMASMLVATQGVIAVVLVPVTAIYFVVQKFYRRTSTALQRLESVSRSPIFANFSQTIASTATLRAYRLRQHFEHLNCTLFNRNNNKLILVLYSQGWLNVRLDALGAVVSFGITVIAVLMKHFGLVTSMMVGWFAVGLLVSLEMLVFLKHMVKMSAVLEADMNAVERVKHYCDEAPQEAPQKVPEDDDGAQWPTQGKIEVKNLSMKYSKDGPTVLKSLSFTVAGREKVGLVGRTGSGKSSFMLALFRMVEPSQGRIFIDGKDTQKMGLSKLRSNISIIPQNPVLFSGTVRFNLDPFNLFKDDKLWEVLRETQLETKIQSNGCTISNRRMTITLTHRTTTTLVPTQAWLEGSALDVS